MGFGLPIALLAGFIFGKWIGTVVIVLSLSIGGTFLYVFGNYFLKDLIKEKVLLKFQNLEKNLKTRNLLIY